MCKIFTRLKIQGKLAQKLLSMVVSLSLMTGIVPGRLAHAAEPTTFVSSAYANHWGRSDLRAYPNNATKTDNTLPIDTATSGTRSGNFPAKFSDAEFGVVQPFTYRTNVLNSNKEATAVYETADRFWLPSGNYSSNQIISWGSEDISANTQYSKSTAADKARIIPISYWSYGASLYSWPRSSSYHYDEFALNACRGDGVRYNPVYSDYPALAAACKINLESDICGSVIFASAASAANLAAAGGAQKIEIAGSENFGKKVEAALPDYGMYLKTASDKSFTANTLGLSGTNLTVNYTGGEAGQYVVVQAFKEDSLTAGTTGCAAAKQLGAGQTSTTIDVTDWGITSLDGYTVKVWMEDGSGSLAKATVPTTFVGTTKTETGAVQNGRVFALQKDLQCSWGSLVNATDLVGEGATNQKIYFGSHNGNPLEFWIAGRETAANGGAIDKDGDIMTLYQAKSVETKQFNASSNNYDVAGKPAVTLQLAENQTALYTGSGASYPAEQITFKQGDADQDKTNLKWLHRAPGTEVWTAGMPTFRGSYELRCYAEGTDNYERTYSAVVNFTATKDVPTAEDFTFTPPENLTYDGDPKEVTVTVNPGITGMGEITIHYYDSDGNLLDSPPVNVGTYTVAIDVAAGDPYTEITGLTDESWTFEITPAPQEPVEIPDGSVEMPETPSEDNQDDGINVLIADVDVTGQTQRIMVRGPYKVLPRGTKLVVEVAPPHEELDDQGYEIEQQTHYNIWLLNEDGTSLPMPLPEKVELLFQILKNGNGDDLEIVLVTEGEDIQFEENTVEIDGIRYRRAYTDHFSPYSLLDKLTEEEKNALNAVKTGDELTYVTISGLGLVMTLALGLMLNSKINKKKSDM